MLYFLGKNDLENEVNPRLSVTEFSHNLLHVGSPELRLNNVKTGQGNSVPTDFKSSAYQEYE